MGTNGKWKNALLSSGVPLEATVARCLSERGCTVFGEYEYVTTTIDDSRLIRSVDVSAWWHLPSVKLDILAECKYRREGIQWFFLPPIPPRLSEADWVTNTLLPPFVPPWYCNYEAIPPVVQFGHHPTSKDKYKVTVVSKGVEIIPGKSNLDPDANETAIKNALTQIRYGAASRMFPFPPLAAADFAEHIYHNFHFILPLIVTTAQLLVFKPDVGVAEIREAEEPNEVATEVNAVICKREIDRRLGRHLQLLLTENYKDLLKVRATAAQAEKAAPRMFGPVPSNRSTFASLQTMHGPDSVVIVGLDHLGSFLDSLNMLFSTPDALQKYKWLDERTATGIVFDIEKHRSIQEASSSPL